MTTRKAKAAESDKSIPPEPAVVDHLDYFQNAQCPLTEAAKVHIWLDWIAGTLERYAEAGLTWTEPGEEATERAEAAIGEYKDLELALYDAETRLDSLIESEEKRQIKVALLTIQSALGDADCPAESALWNGHEDAAIAVIREAFRRAYEQAGHGLRWMASELAIHSDAAPAAMRRTKARLVLYPDRLDVELDGKMYSVTRKAMDLLDVLYAARGAWVGGKTIGGRPDKIIHQVAGPLATLFETHKAEGYRIKPEYFPVSD